MLKNIPLRLEAIAKLLSTLRGGSWGWRNLRTEKTFQKSCKRMQVLPKKINKICQEIESYSMEKNFIQ